MQGKVVHVGRQQQSKCKSSSGQESKGRKSRFGQLNVIMKGEYNSKDKVELTLGDLATLVEIP